MRLKILLVFTFAFILFHKNAFSQMCFPVKKIHAFFEPVKKGVISKDDAKKPQTGGNYLVYIESKKADIILNSIWINGVIYNGQLKEVSTPVITSRAGPNGPLTATKPSSTVVPATKRKVYQVIFTALNPGQKDQVMPARYSTKPLLLELQFKKKIKFFTVSEIRETETVNML